MYIVSTTQYELTSYSVAQPLFGDLVQPWCLPGGAAEPRQPGDTYTPSVTALRHKIFSEDALQTLVIRSARL
jgi:hypothetical protein